MNPARKIRLAAAMLLAASAVSAAAAKPVAVLAACDESCLLGIAGDYMDSLSANDPAGAPLATNVRSTENGQSLALGEGVWKTAHAWSYRHTFVDPVSGEIGFFGAVTEDGDKKSLLTGRLKVAVRKITESELLVVRTGDSALFNPAETEARAAFGTVLPPELRSTREQLKAAARNYFLGIIKSDPSITPFHPDCNRFENGLQTTNNPPMSGTSCAEGLKRLGYMQHYRSLRIPVVDTKRGLVFAVVAFDMPLLTRSFQVRGMTYEINPERQHLPRTLFLFELFKVEGGKIRIIEAKMANKPLGTEMGWAGESR